MIRPKLHVEEERILDVARTRSATLPMLPAPPENLHPPEPNFKKKPTRAYTGWNEEEAERFFEGVKAFGRDFQRLSNHIRSKTYEQVRHFYYRLIKKMNALLEPLGRQVNKSDKYEVRESILFWYEFFKPKGKLTGAPVPGGPEGDKLASALLKFLELRPVVPSKYPPPLAELAQAGRHKTLLPKGQVEPELAQAGRHKTLLPRGQVEPELAHAGRHKTLPPKGQVEPELAHAGRHKTLLPKGQIERVKVTIQSCPASPDIVQPFEPESEPEHTPTPALDMVLVKLVADERLHKTTTPAPTTTTTTTSTTIPTSSRSPPPTAETVQIRTPKRLTLQLLPKEEEIAHQITRAGFNPLLQLTFSSKKPISYIIQHMMKKWSVEVDGTQVSIATGPIRLYPAVPPLEHHSWGVENDNISSASIYQLLSCDGVMRLLYCWLDEKENNNASSQLLHNNCARPSDSTSSSSQQGFFKVERNEAPTSLLSVPAPLLSPIISRPRSPSFSAQSPTSPSRFLSITPTRKSPAGAASLLSTSPSHYAFTSPSGLSSKFKVPDTPNILSLSFLNEPSQDGFQGAENDEKECREFYKEFDATSHDEDSGFAKFFKSAHLEEDSSPIRRRLDFSSFPGPLDSPAPSTGINGTKRRLSDLISPVREDSEDGESLFGQLAVASSANKRKKLSFGGSMPLLPTTSSALSAPVSSFSLAAAAASSSSSEPRPASVNVSLDSLLEETNSNSCFNYWMAETSNG